MPSPKATVLHSSCPVKVPLIDFSVVGISFHFTDARRIFTGQPPILIWILIMNGRNPGLVNFFRWDRSPMVLIGPSRVAYEMLIVVCSLASELLSLEGRFEERQHC